MFYPCELSGVQRPLSVRYMLFSDTIEIDFDKIYFFSFVVNNAASVYVPCCSLHQNWNVDSDKFVTSCYAVPALLTKKHKFAKS